MSLFEHDSPDCRSHEGTSLKQVLQAKEKDIGAFTVRRLLPSLRQRSVGPFVFFDHMGPAELQPGAALSVRPHPHINLATITYLFAGEIVHRDSVGSVQNITPGAINLMTAGRGIVHSERSPTSTLHLSRQVHGIQLWCALSKDDEECLPRFDHYPARALPAINVVDCTIRVLIGSAFGVKSPVVTSLPTLYLELTIPAGSSLELEASSDERAAYVVEGAITCQDGELLEGQLGVFVEYSCPRLVARKDSVVILIGGAPLTEPRHMDWNFISTRKDRIAQAKLDWTSGAFPPVTDDDDEVIPLPA